MIYVFLADGFEEIEAITTIDILRRAKYNVGTVGINSNIVKGAHNIPVMCDTKQTDINYDKIEAIVLPGGMPGTMNLENSECVIKCIDYCITNNRYIAAICAAPSILGHMKILRGLKATCYPGFEKELIGAKICNEAVCLDKKIITARGSGSALLFALKIVESISGKEFSDKIREELQCQ